MELAKSSLQGKDMERGLLDCSRSSVRLDGVATGNVLCRGKTSSAI